MSEEGKSGVGRPKCELTKDQIEQIETLASVLSIEHIANYFGISKVTFYKMMDENPEIVERYKRGKAKAIGTAGKSLLDKVREGNLTAIIFYLKTQAGWRETQVVDNVSSDGSMTPKDKEVQMSKEDLQGALSEALKEITR